MQLSSSRPATPSPSAIVIAHAYAPPATWTTMGGAHAPSDGYETLDTALKVVGARTAGPATGAEAIFRQDDRFFAEPVVATITTPGHPGAAPNTVQRPVHLETGAETPGPFDLDAVDAHGLQGVVDGATYYPAPPNAEQRAADQEAAYVREGGGH